MTFGGGGVIRVAESLLPLLPLSPDPLLEAPWECVVESLLPLLPDSPEPRREPTAVGVITVVVVWESRRQNFIRSIYKTLRNNSEL